MVPAAKPPMYNNNEKDTIIRPIVIHEYSRMVAIQQGSNIQQNAPDNEQQYAN